MATTKNPPAEPLMDVGDAAPPAPNAPVTDVIANGSGAQTGTQEAKSRFNAALEEAKKGANALVEEAKAKAGARREEAKENAQDWTADAKSKAGQMAVEGKHQASEALVSLSTLIDENAAKLDEKFGAQYGDYARNASLSLRETAKTLEEKSYEELGEDAREAIRKSPATAVGIAALAGFIVARIFRR